MSMARPSDHPGFEVLLAEWNQRLKDSGFKDAETSNEVLKKSGSERRFECLDEEMRQARSEYYHVISRRVLEAQFESEIEKEILTLYAQGFTQTAIQQMLRIPGSRWHVYDPIYKWLGRWGIPRGIPRGIPGKKKA